MRGAGRHVERHEHGIPLGPGLHARRVGGVVERDRPGEVDDVALARAAHRRRRGRRRGGGGPGPADPQGPRGHPPGRALEDRRRETPVVSAGVRSVDVAEGSWSGVLTGSESARGVTGRWRPSPRCATAGPAGACTALLEPGRVARLECGGVGLEPAEGSGVAVGVELVADDLELGGDLRGQGRVDLLEAGLEEREGLLRALDVGGEVDEVEVAELLLLAGDLAGLDLLEEPGGAVGEVFRLVGEALGDGRELADVGDEVGGVRLRAGGDRPALPEVALDGVHARPADGRVEVAAAHVDEVVEVARVGGRVGAGLDEALDVGLDLLVEGTHLGVAPSWPPRRHRSPRPSCRPATAVCMSAMVAAT